MSDKILINPMPKCCQECPMHVDKGWGDLRDYCHLTGEDVWDNKYAKVRHERCPLRSAKEAAEELRYLAKAHSSEVPIVYGDGTPDTDRMISMSELGMILHEVLEAESE